MNIAKFLRTHILKNIFYEAVALKSYQTSCIGEIIEGFCPFQNDLLTKLVNYRLVLS